MFEGDGRVFAISTATESGDNLQISYSVPIANILDWFRNWYNPKVVLGRFPRWGFQLVPRTKAFDDEHAFPSQLDGAIVCSKRKTCEYPIKNGDVLVSINRGSDSKFLDKFGYIADPAHGEPRFCTGNKGFIVSCKTESTTLTVWRPNLKATRTFKCAPEPQCEAEKMCFTEFAPPHYCCLGSMVLINATPDFLSGGSPDDSDDEAAVPANAAFHILCKIHANRSKHVVVLSHFHENAYISSTRTFRCGDIITKIGRTEIKSTQHAEKLIQRIATEYANGSRKRVKITTEKSQIWLDLDLLLQEEKLCADERDCEKMLLLRCNTLAQTANQNIVSRRMIQKRVRTAKRPHTSANAVVVSKSRPTSPKCEGKRRKIIR